MGLINNQITSNRLLLPLHLIDYNAFPSVFIITSKELTHAKLNAEYIGILLTSPNFEFHFPLHRVYWKRYTLNAKLIIFTTNSHIYNYFWKFPTDDSYIDIKRIIMKKNKKVCKFWQNFTYSISLET